MSDDLLDALVEAVRAHYEQDNAPPLLLSRFGQSHPELLIRLKAVYVTLSAAVQAAGEARLKVLKHEKGKEVLAPADRAQDITLKVETISASQRDASSRFDSLPRPVQIAFCLRTEGQEVVAVRTTSPWDYRKEASAALVRPGYRIITDEFRRPGLALNHASLTEREALWKSFVAWTERENLDPGAFRSSRDTSALSRLLAAQPPDIISRLVIPADIAEILLRRS